MRSRGNTSIEDLVAQVNTALGVAGLGTQIKAVQVSATQIGLRPFLTA